MAPPIRATAVRRIRHNVHSQNGEDGLLACVLNDIVFAGVPLCRWAVEFGAYDGQTNSNTLTLVESRDFQLVYLEADAAHEHALRQLASSFPPGRVRLHMETVPTGIGGLDSLLHHLEPDLPSDFDVLSIDVDGPDYDIWLHSCDYRPKVVIIETHSVWPPGDVVVAQPGVPHGQRGGSSSLTAVAQLAERKGYVPVDYTGNLVCVSREIFDRVYPGRKPPTLDALFRQLSRPVPLVVRPEEVAVEPPQPILQPTHREAPSAGPERSNPVLAGSRFVVYSSDTQDYYSFLLPIAARVWSRMGYQPISLLYGSRDLWMSDPKTALILSLIEPLSIVRHVSIVPGWSVFAIAASSRLFAAALPDVSDDDYIMTSDVDLIPLDRAYFSQHDLSRSFTFLNADGYGDCSDAAPGQLPMCNLAGWARRWRDVLGLTTKDIDFEIARASASWVDHWSNDEVYFYRKLCAHPCFQGPLERESATSFRKGDCQLIKRRFIGGIATRRLDRVVDWNYYGARDLIDCHAHRPAYEKLEPLVALLEAYFPSDMPFFRSYFSEFLRLKANERASHASSRRARDVGSTEDRARRAGYTRVRGSRAMARTRSITFAGSSISIEYDAEGEELVRRLFHALPARRSAAARSRMRVGCGRNAGALAVHCDDALVYEGDCRDTAAFFLLDTVQRRLAEQSRGGALLHAATVARRGRAILIPGPPGAGKSSLAAWLTNNGFDLLGDELAFIRSGARRVEGFTTPVTIKEEGREVLDGWLVARNRPAPNPTARLLIAPERLNPETVRRPADLALVLLPNYADGAECELAALSKADAAVRLIGSLTNAAALPDNGFDEIVRLANMVPAYTLRYSDFAQVGRSLEPLLAARVGK